MNEPTANTEPTPDVPSEDAPKVAGQTTPDQDSTAISELRAKNTEQGTTIATLQKALDEARVAKTTYPQQPQGVDQAQLQSAMESLTDGDASAATQKLETVMNTAGNGIANNAVNEVRAYLEIQRDLDSKGQDRPYIKQARVMVEQQISNYITTGYDPKAATDAAIRDFDNLFKTQGEPDKPKQEPAPPPEEAPTGTQGMTGQGTPITPPAPTVPETQDGYIASRIIARNARLGGVLRQ